MSFSIPLTPSSPVLSGLYPAPLYALFDQIRQIPRSSGQESGVRSFLRKLAESKSWGLREDKIGNLVLCVPGKGIGKASPVLVIQNHMDMVCIKEPESPHNFDSDPIELIRSETTVEGRKVPTIKAQGTTLGADDGIGLAAGIAIALDPSVTSHPPLELLCTVDEEVGMAGAIQIDPSMILGRRMLNLDTEEHGIIYISSAGSVDMTVSWNLTQTQLESGTTCCQFDLLGLPGGHSGCQIHEGIVSSVQALLAALNEVLEGPNEFRLIRIQGGDRRNAIAKDSFAQLAVKESDYAQLEQALLSSKAVGKLRTRHPSAKVTLRRIELEGPQYAISSADTKKLVGALTKIPQGVLKMSEAVDGLVETSNNQGLLRSEGGVFSLINMTRSSKDGAVTEFHKDIAARIADSSPTIEYANFTAGWEADKDNPLLKKALDVFPKVLGTVPKVAAIHAGLECGVFTKHFPGIKIISFGPDLKFAHTPEECLLLESVPPFWDCLKALVQEL